MKFLLDTHIWIWVLTDDPRLSRKARRELGGADEWYYSAASVWELAIKSSKEQFPIDLELLLYESEQSDLSPLAITPAHAFRVQTLPDLHSDPFDRLLVAQALSEPLILITADKTLGRYSKQVRVV